MIQRFEIRNYRPHQSTVLDLSCLPSALLVGRNGTGKSSVGASLLLLRSIARGKNRIGHLITKKDMRFWDPSLVVRFHLESILEDQRFVYSLALELPEGFKELRIAEETLLHEGEEVFKREKAQVDLHPRAGRGAGRFSIDWHLAALPIIQEASSEDPLGVFKRWLGSMLVLQPQPPLMAGESDDAVDVPDPSLSNYASWLTSILLDHPVQYSTIESMVRQFLPDFYDIQNPQSGGDSRTLRPQFKDKAGSFQPAFEMLSDGEKAIFAAATVAAALKASPGTFCFWDEIDSHLALPEVEQFVMEMRRQASQRGQMLVTSHQAEAIRCFSDENTFLIDRRTRLEPPIVRRLDEISYEGDLPEALIYDRIRP